MPASAARASQSSERVERDALEIGAAIDDRRKSQLAGALAEHLDLSIWLEPSRRDNERLRSLERGDRRQQEGRGVLLSCCVAVDRPDRGSLGNPREDVDAGAQFEVYRDREPFDRAEKKGLRVRQPDTEQLPEHQTRACGRIDSRKAQPGGALVPDLPSLDREIRRRGGLILMARRDPPESRYLLVLHLGHLLGASPGRERAAGDEVMHRRHSRADLCRAARAAPRMRARLLVLAPPAIEHGEQAFGERGGHVLTQTERRRALALAQQANALAHAAPELLDVENAGRVAFRHAARSTG